MFCDSVKEIVIKALAGGQLFQHADNVFVRAEFLFYNVIHADILVFISNEMAWSFFFEQ